MHNFLSIHILIMILNFVKYLYSLLFSIFIFLLVSSFFYENISLNNNFIYLFSLLVIPVADIIVEKVKMNIKLLVFIALVLFGYTYIFSITGNEDIIEASLMYSYIFLITWAITQYVWFIIESKNKKLSLFQLWKKSKKWLDDYFYMIYIIIWILFLIWFTIAVLKFIFADYSLWKLAWVFLAFTLTLSITSKINVNIKKFLHNHLKNINSDNFNKFRDNLNDNKLFKVLAWLDIRNDIVFYLIFIFFTLIFSIWYIYDVEELLILSYVLIFISYIAFKIYWFKIDSLINKKDLSSNNFLLNLIVFTVLFALSTNKILEWYVLNGYKNFTISVFTLIYLYIFTLIFSDFKFNSITQKHISLQKIKLINLNIFHKSKKRNYALIWSIILSIIIVSITIIYDIKDVDREKYISKVTITENTDDTQAVNNEDDTTDNTENTDITDEEITDDTENTQTSDDIVTNNDEEEILVDDEENTLSASGELSESWTTDKIKIWELYKFENYLSVWNESEDTMKLEEYMKKLWYAVWEVDGVFDVNTKIALRNILMYECHWPTTAKWVLWTNAAECIEWLEIEKE